MAVSITRFEAVTVDGVPTVRDNERSMVVSHAGVWTTALAAEFARELEGNPGPARLLTWEEARDETREGL